MNGIYPFSDPGPGAGPNTPASESSVIKSPFGPTVGPLAESNTGTTSPSSPLSPSSTGSVDSNATEKGPRLLTKSERASAPSPSLPSPSASLPSSSASEHTYPPMPKIGNPPIPKTNYGKPISYSAFD